MSVPRVERPRAVCPGCGAKVNEQPRGNVPSSSHLSTKKCMAARAGKSTQWELSTTSISILRDAKDSAIGTEDHPKETLAQLFALGFIERTDNHGRGANGYRFAKTTEAGRQWLAGFDGRKR